jgi:hypothetical protein
MFSKLFQDDSDDARKERAKLAYEKISALKKEGSSRDTRSARMRMVLLCRAHLDKTFVEGAEKSVAYDVLAMQSIMAGQDKPPLPLANEFQQIPAVSGDKVWVYLPQEYADLAFSLGASYQRTDLSAQQAIDAMQALANQIFSTELGIHDNFMVLQFLRNEIDYQGTTLPTAGAEGTGGAAPSDNASDASASALSTPSAP